MNYEAILLGTMIVDPAFYHEHSRRISDQMFEDINNQYIYKAYRSLVKKGQEPNLVSLNKEMGGKEEYLQTLMDVTSLPILLPREVMSILGSLEEKAKYKIISGFAVELHNMVQNGEEFNKMQSYVEKLQGTLNQDNSVTDKSFITQLKDFREEIAKRVAIDGITGVTTGFKVLDDFTNGWQPSDLVIVGAASSMGKTSLAVMLAYNAAINGEPIAIFSYEMSSIQLIQRMVSIDSGVQQHWMNKGALDKGEMKKIDNSISQIESIPMVIDDCNDTSINYLVARIKQYVHSHKVKLVMVDYLQLVSARTGRSGNREQEVAKVARRLKNLAKELNIAIIALSQLSRGVGARTNSRPTLSDLRESGEIEQAADVVILLYRPEYYGIYENEGGEATQGLAEIIFAKGRNIGVGTVNLKFIPELTKFENYD